MSAEFDKLANSYEEWHSQLISGSGWPREYFLEYKIRETARVLAWAGFAPRKILDFGCGVGDVTPYIRKYFPDAEIFGTDISAGCIATARAKNYPNVNYAALPDGWPLSPAFPFDDTFDLVFISNVFHHTPPEMHLAALSALQAKMRVGARIFIFEINPYNPATRHVFNKYEKPIDKNANLVKPRYLNKLMRRAGLSTSRNMYTVFFPRFLRFLLPLERLINWVPMGAHYYIRGVSPP